MSKEKVLEHCRNAANIVTDSIRDGGRWPVFNNYVFQEEDWNNETIYSLELLTGSIRYSMHDGLPGSDPVWDRALAVFGDFQYS